METRQTKKTIHFVKVEILILLFICILFTRCKKEDEYKTNDISTNPIGAGGENVTGLFNVYVQRTPIGPIEDFGIEEISYESESNLIISKKVLGKSTIRIGEIQWQCLYITDVNRGIYFIHNASGFISQINCNFRIVDKNQIICEADNSIKIYLIRRFVKSK